jgi:uncharacterized membrane protein
VAERPPRRDRLDVPAGQRRSLRPSYDPEAFGRASERIARFLGTSRFLVYLTVVVVVWLAWNYFAPESVQFDPRSKNFTLLTLILSLQASYAAPLILLAQNRQTDRDRVSLDEDRATNARLMAEVEYLSRELAALRQTVGEVATRDFLREQLREATEEVVARVASPGSVPYDEVARAEREERKKRQERKRRAKEKREAEQKNASPEVPGTLTEPFGGEQDER